MMWQHQILVPCEDCGETFDNPEEYIYHAVLQHSSTPPSPYAPQTRSRASVPSPPLPRLPAQRVPPPQLPPPVPTAGPQMFPPPPPSSIPDFSQPPPPTARGHPAMPMMPPYMIQNPLFRR